MILFTVYSNEVATTPPRMKTMRAQEKEDNIVIYPHPEWMRKTMSFIPTQSGLINVR
jgi:hypothetical protein